MRDRNGRSKGFAFVQFEEGETAVQAALLLDKTLVAARPIKVKPSETAAKVESEKSSGGTTLFGYNFQLSVTEKDVHTIFGKFGEISQVMIGKKGRPNGFVYIEFKDKSGLDGALSMDGSMINGKKISCRRSKQTISGEPVVAEPPKPEPVPPKPIEKPNEAQRLQPVKRVVPGGKQAALKAAAAAKKKAAAAAAAAKGEAKADDTAGEEKPAEAPKSQNHFRDLWAKRGEFK